MPHSSVRWQYTAAALVAAAVLGCADAPAPAPASAANSFAPLGVQPGTEHPTPENLPAAADLAASIPMSKEIRGDGPAQAFARRLAAMREVASFGAMEGDPTEVFGQVEDVALDDAGRLLVLDSRYNNVRVHDASGRPLVAFSGPGNGPGELRAPEALERSPQGQILVADRHNKINLYEPRGASYVPSGSISVRFVPEDFCMMNDELYVQGIARGNFIHVFSTAGVALRSFGRPYVTANGLVREQLSDGPIACSQEAGAVVTMLKYLPIVYGYSARGELLWRSKLASFRPLRIVEGLNPRGQPRVTFHGEDPHELVESLQAAPGGMVVVQTALFTPQSREERREFAELRTYVLSAATGQGVYVGNHLPRISALTGSRVLAAENDPFPRVRVFALAPAREGR